MTDDFISFFLSPTSSVPAAGIYPAFWTAVAASIVFWDAVAVSVSILAGSCSFAVSYNEDPVIVLGITRSESLTTAEKLDALLRLGRRFLFFTSILDRLSEFDDYLLVPRACSVLRRNTSVIR